VIEDNAHGLGGTYQERRLGSIGTFATLSFHETKNVQCGEGGALLVNDSSFFEDAEIIREKGTNRSRFFRGQVDKYTWVAVGSSYLPSDMLAAYLSTQLLAFEEIQTVRLAIWNRYREELSDWSAQHGFTFQHCPEDRQHSAHLFALLAPDLETRGRFIDHLGARNVKAVFHYVPLHSAPAGISYGNVTLPVTDDVSDRLVRLPLFVGLEPAAQARVIEAVTSFR
jgi:dTDP-4-amino-4,6-dideoxygalactose transaminase